MNYLRILKKKTHNFFTGVYKFVDVKSIWKNIPTF